MSIKCSPHWDDFCIYDGILKLIIPSSHEKRTILTRTPLWDVICEYEEVLNFSIQLSHDMHEIFTSFLGWDDHRHDMPYRISVLMPFLSLYDAHSHSRDCCEVLCCEAVVLKFAFEHPMALNGTYHAVNNGCQFIYFLAPLCDKYELFRLLKNWPRCCWFKDEVLPYPQQSHFLLFCPFILAIFEFRHWKYLLCAFYLKAHDKLALIEWLTYVYKCTHSYGILMQEEKIKIKKGYNGKEGALLANNNNKMKNKNIFENYFRAGGRHQTMVDGEIVCEYLQTCTDAKLLNDCQYFEGKLFEFIGYDLCRHTSNCILDPSIPTFSSKIPLDKLSIYLNVKELRDVSKLHNISIPKKIERKKC